MQEMILHGGLLYRGKCYFTYLPSQDVYKRQLQLAQLLAQLLGLGQNGDVVGVAQLCGLGQHGGEVQDVYKRQASLWDAAPILSCKTAPTA